jgi:phasin family protein
MRSGRRPANTFFSDSKGMPMTSRPEDFLMQAWKKQLDAGLRMMEAIIEGATKVHEARLQAAAQAHADAEATRKAIAAATDLSQIFKLQTEWARANAQKSLAYWRSMAETVGQTDAELVKCVCSQAPVALPEMVKAGDLDALYKQWLDSLRQLYKPVERASQ